MAQQKNKEEILQAIRAIEKKIEDLDISQKNIKDVSDVVKDTLERQRILEKIYLEGTLKKLKQELLLAA